VNQPDRSDQPGLGGSPHQLDDEEQQGCKPYHIHNDHESHCNIDPFISSSARAALITPNSSQRPCLRVFQLTDRSRCGWQGGAQVAAKFYRTKSIFYPQARALKYRTFLFKGALEQRAFRVLIPLRAGAR
jgi:hypothetical protein